jgi:prephenate dehydrogenase
VLRDRDPEHLRRAGNLGAGRAGGFAGPADVCVLAVPPPAVAAALREAQQAGTARVYTDVSSVKVRVQHEVGAAGCDLASFVGGHPIAGRERSGPDAARGDLFAGSTWVLTPSERSSAGATAVVTRLVELCSAVPVVMSPTEHDQAMALVSHGPQVVASAVAARLAAAPDPALVELAGQGVRDVTRIAASDPDLWTGILAGNAGPVADVLAGVAADLERAVTALRALDRSPADDAARSAVHDLIAVGNAGHARIPGKHGAPPTTYAVVPVVVTDRPAQLAGLLVDAGKAGVNVEDVSIEHAFGQPVGLVELAVRPEHADRLAEALRSAGWTVHR